MEFKFNNFLVKKTNNDNKFGSEVKETKKFITIEDIPTYMYGDRGEGTIFDKQTDFKAKIMSNYTGWSNIKTGRDNREYFDGANMCRVGEKYVSENDKTNDAEIIRKEEIVKIKEQDIRKEPFLKRSKEKEKFQEIQRELYDVLNIYLIAQGPRGTSTTVIGIRIPEGVEPAPFMKQLAEEIFKKDEKEIGALYFSRKGFEPIDYNEFDKRQDKLKAFAQELFLKYANEQLNNKNR